MSFKLLTAEQRPDVARVFITLKPTSHEIRMGKIYETLETLDRINDDNKESIGKDDIAAMLLKKQLLKELNVLKNQVKPAHNKTPKHITKGFEVRAAGRKKYHRNKKTVTDTNLKKIIGDKKSAKNKKDKKDKKDKTRRKKNKDNKK